MVLVPRAAFFISAGNPTLVLAVFGAISALEIVLAYFWGKQVKDARLGTVSAGMVAVPPFFVGTAAQLWNPNLVPVLTLGYFLSLWYILVKRGRLFWVAFYLGAIFEFHIGFGTMLFLSTCVSLLLLRLVPTVKQSVLSFGVFTFWVLPRVVLDLRNVKICCGVPQKPNPETRPTRYSKPHGRPVADIFSVPLGKETRRLIKIN